MKNGFVVKYKYYPNGDETDKLMCFLEDGSFALPCFGPTYVEKSDLTEIRNNNQLVFLFKEMEAEIKINSDRIDCITGFNRDGSSHRIELNPTEKRRVEKWLSTCYGI